MGVVFISQEINMANPTFRDFLISVINDYKKNGFDKASIKVITADLSKILSENTHVTQAEELQENKTLLTKPSEKAKPKKTEKNELLKPDSPPKKNR